jgi:hypothetical protein
VFWKIVFWLWAASSVRDFVSLLGSPPLWGWVWPVSLVMLAINYLGLVSLYGFAFGKRVGWHGLAIATFVLNVAAQIFGLYIGRAWFAALFNLPFGWTGLSMALVLSFAVLITWLYPIYAYAYAFRSRGLWAVNA